MSEPRTEAGRTVISNWSAGFLNGWDLPTITEHVEAIEREAAALAGPGADRLDVERVKRAVNAVAVRHGLAKDPPVPFSVASIFGYSMAPAAMDAEIAAEYAALSRSETT